MSNRVGKMATTTSVVAQGPAGVRRIFAGCLIVLMLGVLAVGGLTGFGARSARNAKAAALPCPSETGAVAYSTKDTPEGARQAVEEFLREAGRKSATVGWGAERRHLVIVWSPGPATQVGTASNPTRLTFGTVPTSGEVRKALGARLAPCQPTEGPSAEPAPASPRSPARACPGRGSGGST